MSSAQKGPTNQAEVIAFLRRFDGLGANDIEVFETHGAFVFVGSRKALKIKRAIRYAYMDFSTLELRRAACLREIEVNRPHAPEIYLQALPITREPDGRLTLAGSGEPVEWAVLMRRFSQQDVLVRRLTAGPLTPELSKAIADAVYSYHTRAPAIPRVDSPGRMAGVLRDVDDGLKSLADVFPAAARAHWRQQSEVHLARVIALLAERARLGFVRRCHGDLHLGNMVLWRGRPVAFDAIEFDEGLATIDTLYDLAFLLMDLDQRCHRDAANAILNRYLWRSGRQEDIAGLAALPVFLSLRAAIRAMVIAQKARLLEGEHRAGEETLASAYFKAARDYLVDQKPQLIAIGGLSGTGKSTLAAQVAPYMGRAPGSLHLRSDLERKALFDVEETQHLSAEHYTVDASQRVYERLYERTRIGLEAGRSVVVDAVFARPEERAAIAQVAERLGLAFRGLWLTAPAETLLARVGSRAGDASDATRDTVEQQLSWQLGEINWQLVDASGTRDETLAGVRKRLEGVLPHVAF